LRTCQEHYLHYIFAMCIAHMLFNFTSDCGAASFLCGFG
jgi:hypothetical protein